MCGKNPLNDIADTLVQTSTGGMASYDSSKNGLKSGAMADLQDSAGKEFSKAFGEVSGKNAFEANQKRISDKQEADANRLLWEKDNALAQSKEADLQAEARKRLKSSQLNGRSGTILTGYNTNTSNAQIGGSGTNLLGA